MKIKIILWRACAQPERNVLRFPVYNLNASRYYPINCLANFELKTGFVCGNTLVMNVFLLPFEAALLVLLLAIFQCTMYEIRYTKVGDCSIVSGFSSFYLDGNLFRQSSVNVSIE